jgi:hypothetical protein
MLHEMFQPHQHNFQHLENIHFVSSFSQWRNGRCSCDTMIMHKLSACKQDSKHAKRRATKTRLSDTNELLDCTWNVRRDGYIIIENKAALV